MKSFIYLAGVIGLLFAIATTFSIIRYNDLAKQNMDLRGELRSLENRISEMSYNKKAEVPVTSNGSDSSAYIVASKIEKLESEIASIKDNKIEQIPEQRADNISISSDTFQDAVYKVFQKKTADSFQKHSINADKKYLDFLDKELALTLTQKDEIQKILNAKENTLQELFQKNLAEQNLTGMEFYGEINKIHEETYTNIAGFLGSNQLTKFNQLKAEGKFFAFNAM